MKLMFAKIQEGYGWDPLELFKPVTYGYARLSAKFRKPARIEAEESPRRELVCEFNGRRTALRTIHVRILAERESLCRLYAVECRTFVQPFPGVHGHFHDVALAERDRNLMRGKFIHLEDNWRKAGAIFVTDALDQHDRHAYIDESHYSAAASRLIAQAIASRLGNQRK